MAKSYLFIGGPIDGQRKVIPEQLDCVEIHVLRDSPGVEYLLVDMTKPVAIDVARYWLIPLDLDESKGNDRFIYSYEYMTVPQIIDALLVNYQRRQEDEE